MATDSFDKNIVIKETEAIEILVKAFSSKAVKPVDKALASDESMARGVKLLKQSLSQECYNQE